MKNTIKAVRFLTTAIGFAIALAIAPIFIANLMGFEPLVLTGGSMGESIPMGSVVFSKSVSVEEVSVSDVVVFRHGRGAITTHRVVAIVEEGAGRVFTTKGDANDSIDPQPLVSLEGKAQKVIWHLPLIGRIAALGRSRAGGIVLFGLPILGLLLSDGRKRKQRSPNHRSATYLRSPTLAFEEE